MHRLDPGMQLHARYRGFVHVRMPSGTAMETSALFA